MSLADLINALAADLTRPLPRNTASFAESRALRPELAPFATVADLRLALDSTSSLDPDARRALVAVLVEEAQTGTSPLWSTLLVLAFAPMLQRVRKHVDPRPRDEDLDGAILAAFLGAVRAVRAGPYTSLALRWATEKEVLTARIAERRLGRLAGFNERVHSNAAGQLRETEPDRALDEVLRVLEKEGAAEILDILIATRGRDESLRAYVARTCRNKRERASRYEHLCRARLRFERELRERLTPEAA